MLTPRSLGIHLIESSDIRLRRSRELSAKSHDYACRSHDLVLRSRALLAREQPTVLPHAPEAAVAPPQEEAPAVEAHPLAGDLLQVVSGQTIQSQVVNLDGTHFVDCELRGCTLRYSGLPVVIEATLFEDCTFQFAGEAALTIRLLECFELLPHGKIDYALPSHASGPPRPN